MIGLTLALALMSAGGPDTAATQEIPPPACRADAQGVMDYQACADATPKGSAGHAFALINLATQAYLDHDFPTALRLYDEAAPAGQTITSDVLFHTFRGDTFRHAGRMAESQADARRAWLMLIDDPSVAGDPRDRRELTDDQRLFVLGILLPILKDGDGAIFERARAMFMTLPATDWPQISNRATTLEALGDYEAAVAESKRAVDMQPDDAGLLNNHCYILVEAGHAAQALPFCERAIALQPAEAAFRHSYASTLAGLGQCVQAEVQLAEARRLDPSSVLYRQPLTCTAKR